ncbi:hypothetical protein [Sphingomonas sp. LY160]|uniref:hypothetical protein n=1 Tax=Sphingomonas sp. LY160 TaxID=3095342 RepID=UPI002ADED887|nr:hypothetical protein [Sphingomonas sp. LY160]MEA1071082.1 hypothetical protein [Sphingomonas sp. LY160]
MSITADDAFRAYGRVMAKVGALEQYMRIALLEHEQSRCASKGRGHDDLERYVVKVMKYTFGALLQQVHDKYKLGPAFLDTLKEVKSFRDYLAHEFWVAYFPALRTERGRKIIIEHCALYERSFDRVGDVFVAQSGLDITPYITSLDREATSESRLAGWEARLQGHVPTEAI